MEIIREKEKVLLKWKVKIIKKVIKRNNNQYVQNLVSIPKELSDSFNFDEEIFFLLKENSIYISDIVPKHIEFKKIKLHRNKTNSGFNYRFTLPKNLFNDNHDFVYFLLDTSLLGYDILKGKIRISFE